MGCQVRQVRAVLRRDDESELVAIILAALKERSAIGAVLGRRIELMLVNSRQFLLERAIRIDRREGRCRPESDLIAR
jgi:hypothetical protein